MITIERPPETTGEPRRLVRIALRVKEPAAQAQVIETAGPHAVQGAE